MACARDGLTARSLRTLGTLRTLGAFGALGPVVALGAIGALRPVRTLSAFGAVVAIGALRAVAVLAVAVAARRGALLVAVVVVVRLIVGTGRFLVAVAIILVARAALILFLEARATVFQHAEIMIGELEVIFGLHAVAGELHVARERLIFFEQLCGIAALAIVLAIAIRTTGHTLGTLSTATATAAALAIIDQESCSLSHRAPATEANALKSSFARKRWSRRGDRPAQTLAQVDPPLPSVARWGVSAAISSGVGGGSASNV